MDIRGVFHTREFVVRRELHVSEDLVRAYSRRGNFHSDASTSKELGLPGLVAQGVQAAGPAYGLLLDAWGEEFLAHGIIEMRFVGMVLAGHTIEASVDPATGEFTVENRTAAIAEAVKRRIIRTQ